MGLDMSLLCPKSLGSQFYDDDEDDDDDNGEV